MSGYHHTIAPSSGNATKGLQSGNSTFMHSRDSSYTTSNNLQDMSQLNSFQSTQNDSLSSIPSIPANTSLGGGMGSVGASGIGTATTTAAPVIGPDVNSSTAAADVIASFTSPKKISALEAYTPDRGSGRQHNLLKLGGNKNLGNSDGANGKAGLATQSRQQSHSGQSSSDHSGHSGQSGQNEKNCQNGQNGQNNQNSQSNQSSTNNQNDSNGQNLNHHQSSPAFWNFVQFSTPNGQQSPLRKEGHENDDGNVRGGGKGRDNDDGDGGDDDLGDLDASPVNGSPTMNRKHNVTGGTSMKKENKPLSVEDHKSSPFKNDQRAGVVDS